VAASVANLCTLVAYMEKIILHSLTTMWSSSSLGFRLIHSLLLLSSRGSDSCIASMVRSPRGGPAVVVQRLASGIIGSAHSCGPPYPFLLLFALGLISSNTVGLGSAKPVDGRIQIRAHGHQLGQSSLHDSAVE
jgi:hypothetical protein